MIKVSVIILTYNEELHIERCINKLVPHFNDIIIVDSFSTDKTIDILKNYNVRVYFNKWPGNQSRQFNWALNNLDFKFDWVLRLDADEYLTDDLLNEFYLKLNKIGIEYTGVILKRRHIFLNKWVKRGIYPVKLLRLFKHKDAFYPDIWMDEHIVLLQGVTLEFDHDFVDHNLNDISWWSKKHVEYATREAIELLDIEFDLKSKYNSVPFNINGLKSRSKRTRYYYSPILLRALVYFCYRFFWRLGFLDGKIGFIWNFLQGFWYRVLVDAKVIEIKQKCENDREKIIHYLKTEYNYDV